MNRYISSFILSMTIYAGSIVSIFYFLNCDNCDTNAKIEKKRVVKISLLNLEKQVIIAKEKEKKVSEIKSKPTPQVKKEQRVTIKSTPKLEPKEEQFVQSSQKKEEIKVVKKTTVKTTHQNNINTMENILIAKKELEDREKSFFLDLRELINQNKSYPNSARRRSIQGNVEVKFSILENGNVKNIELLSGKPIFKKSTIQAIERSFPIDINKTLFTFPKEFKITIAYILK